MPSQRLWRWREHFLLNARHELIITHPSELRQENLSPGLACSRMSLLKCLRPHSSTHVPLHLRYAITIILALTRAQHSQLFNKLRSTSIALHYKSLFYIPLLLHLLSLYFLPLYIRLNQFYLSSHSCFFFLPLFLYHCFYFVFVFFNPFFSIFFSFFIIIYFSLSPPSPSVSLPLSSSISLTISPYFLYFIFLSFLFLYPHRCPSLYKLCHRNISGVDQTTTFPTFLFLLSFSLLWYSFFLLSSISFLSSFVFSLLTSILYFPLS